MLFYISFQLLVTTPAPSPVSGLFCPDAHTCRRSPPPCDPKLLPIDLIPIHCVLDVWQRYAEVYAEFISDNVELSESEI